MDPINYLAMVPQQDFLRNIQGGFQLGAGIREARQLEAARDMALQQKQIAQQRAAQYQADVTAAMSAPTPQAFSALALKYPEQREAVKQAWDQQDSATRKSQGEAALQVSFALESGNKEVAKKLLQDRISALDNSSADSSHEKLILGAIDTHPKEVRSQLLQWAAFTQDPEKFAENYGRLGQEQRAQQLQPDLVRKGAADASEAESDVATKNLGIVAQKAGALAKPGVKPSQAQTMFRSLAAQGVIPKDELQGYLDGIPVDPKALPEYLRQVQAAGLSANEQRKYTDVDANTAANNATSRANTAANNATQIKTTGMNNSTQLAVQDRIDQREKSKDPASKPLPASALKMQKAELDALSTASGIDSDLARVESQITGGKLSFGPVSNFVNRSRNAAGISTEESRNFASFQSTLEKLRNDSLRLNAGVQTDGDAQRAWNELFANINDEGVVKQRLAEIRNINQRAAQLRKLNIDGIRANYGHEPLDTSQYEAATSAGKNGPAIGTVDGGYRFKGGDPSQKSSWELIR